MEVRPHPDVQVPVGIFGGSGLYELLDDAVELDLDTPYGKPSAPLTIGQIGGRGVAFLPRHGHGHTFPPHLVPYRANAWAMKHVGVTDMVLPCAAGSLQADVAPGSFVVADQLVDRTKGRADTFHEGPDVVHVSFAEPYDAEMRAVAIERARALGIEVHDEGTLVVIQGPRFSTKAESRWFSSAGWRVIGMTGYPEAVLCRELEMAAVNISLVTDYDAGLDDGSEAVTSTRVLEVFNANLEKLRDLLFALVPALPLSPDRPALSALGDAAI